MPLDCSSKFEYGGRCQLLSVIRCKTLHSAQSTNYLQRKFNARVLLLSALFAFPQILINSLAYGSFHFLDQWLHLCNVGRCTPFHLRILVHTWWNWSPARPINYQETTNPRLGKVSRAKIYWIELKFVAASLSLFVLVFWGFCSLLFLYNVRASLLLCFFFVFHAIKLLQKCWSILNYIETEKLRGWYYILL